MVFAEFNVGQNDFTGGQKWKRNTDAVMTYCTEAMTILSFVM